MAAKKKQVEESAEQQAAAELVRLAKQQGLSLTGTAVEHGVRTHSVLHRLIAHFISALSRR